MKQIIILALLLVGLNVSAQVTLTDTIFTNFKNTTYFILPDKVVLFDTGIDYVAKIESGNLIFIRPRSPKSPTAPFIVRTESNTYMGYLGTSQRKSRPFIKLESLLPAELVEVERLVLMAQNDSTDLEKDEKLNANRSLTFLAKDDSIQQDYIRTLQTVSKKQKNEKLVKENSGIVMTLQRLYHDEKGTYIEVEVHNKTSMKYTVDDITFQYTNQVRRKRTNYLTPEIFPLQAYVRENVGDIEGGGKRTMSFIIPLFASNDASVFIMRLVEANGTRNVELNLPNKKILYADKIAKR